MLKFAIEIRYIHKPITTRRWYENLPNKCTSHRIGTTLFLLDHGGIVKTQMIQSPTRFFLRAYSRWCFDEIQSPRIGVSIKSINILMEKEIIRSFLHENGVLKDFFGIAIVL